MAEIYFDRLPNPKREYAVRAWAASAVIAVNSDRPFECRSIRRSQRIASAIFFNGAAMELRFETRGLPPRGEYLKSTDLCEGEAYFIVDYSDAALLIPQLTPVVFVGRDIETRGSGKVYFQDIDSAYAIHPSGSDRSRACTAASSRFATTSTRRSRRGSGCWWPGTPAGPPCSTT